MNSGLIKLCFYLYYFTLCYKSHAESLSVNTSSLASSSSPTTSTRTRLSVLKNSLLITAEDYKLKFWRIDTGQLTKYFFCDGCISLKLIADTDVVATGCNNGSIRLFDYAKDQFIGSLTGHSDRVNHLTLMARNTLMASGSNDKTIRIWRLTSGVCVRTIVLLDAVISLEALPNQKLASLTRDERIQIWNVNNGECIYTIKKKDAWHMSVLNDGSQLAISTTRGATHVLDVARYEWHTLLDYKYYYYMLPTSEPLTGSDLLAIGNNYAVEIWNVTKGVRVNRLVGKHNVKCLKAVQTSDGGSELLAIGSVDGYIQILNITSGELVKQMGSQCIYSFESRLI